MVQKQNKLTVKYYSNKDKEGLNSAFDILFDNTLYNMKKDKETKERVDFHVKNGDYFATVATAISLVGQGLEKENRKYEEVLNNLVRELMYLDENYKINKL